MYPTRAAAIAGTLELLGAMAGVDVTGEVALRARLDARFAQVFRPTADGFERPPSPTSRMLVITWEPTTPTSAA